MCRWVRCWLERPMHLSPEQGPKLSPLRLSAARCPGSLHRRDTASEEEPVAREEALGEYPIFQERIERPGLRHGTERESHNPSHCWLARESPQTRGRDVQAWSIRSSDSISDGWQRQSENPNACDQRSYQEGSRPSSRRV